MSDVIRPASPVPVKLYEIVIFMLHIEHLKRPL